LVSLKIEGQIDLKRYRFI